MAKYTQARIDEIRSRLADLERRGIGVSELAREIGVVPRTIYQWKRRFTPSAERPGRATTRTAASRLSADLIEIGHPSGPSGIEIVLDAVTVRVPPRFDAGDLERVLQVVHRC